MALKYKWEMNDRGSHKLSIGYDERAMVESPWTNYGYPANCRFEGRDFMICTDAWKGILPTETLLEVVKPTDVEKV